MKILIHGLNFSPELVGIGKYTGELAQYLASKGHRVTVVTTPPYYPGWSVGAGYSGWRYKTETLENIKIIRCPLWVPNQVSGLKRILHLLSFAFSSAPVVWREARHKPDVVLAIAPALLAAPSAALAGKRAGACTWLHIQDFEVDAALDLGILKKNSSMRGIALNFEKWVYGKFERVSSISEKMLTRLAEKGVPAEKIVNFPNWVDSAAIFPVQGPNPYRQDLDLSEEGIVVLYSGSMGAKQGLEVVVEAARLLEEETNLHFVFCGEGPARAGLQRAAAGCGNVHFLPLQPAENLNTLLNLADIHILPQSADAADLVMPSKLLGMLASGKAVIATANPGTGLANIICEVGVLVAPGDPAALSEAVRSLAGSPQQRKIFGEKSRSLVCKTWGKEAVLSGFEAELKEIIGS